MGQMAAMMANQYVQGIDRTKPVTIMVNAENGELKPMAVLPVTDLPRFLDSLSQSMGEVQDAGNGVYELSTPAGPTYVKQQGGWAFAGQNLEALHALPPNPTNISGGLNKEYDVAVRGHLKNLPDTYKQMALAKIKEGVAQQLESSSDLSPEEAELQRKLVQSNIEQWESMLNELDTFTVGWMIDSQTHRTYIDAITTAIPGTKSARQMAALKDIRSDFAGFFVPGAAATFNAAGEMTEPDIQQALSMMKPLRETAKQEIDEDDTLPDDEARAAARKLIDQLFVVFEETIREGKVDLGAALVLENGTMAMTAGFAVADGNKVEASIRELGEIAQKDPDFPGIQFNVATETGVRYHSMRIPVPNDQTARELFGDQLDVVVGISDKAAYFGFGENSLGLLRKAVAHSAANTDPSSPMRMNIALAPIMEFVSNFEDNPMVAALAETLKSNKGRDNIVITSTAIPNGARYRFEVQEGVLKSIGQATAPAAQTR